MLSSAKKNFFHILILGFCHLVGPVHWHSTAFARILESLSTYSALGCHCTDGACIAGPSVLSATLIT